MAQSLLRKTLKVFGLGGTTDDFEQFGSTAVSSTNYTKDIATIQGLSAWTNGWRPALVTAKAPVLQDMNAVMYVHSYIEAYMLQEGIPEWDAGTTYNKGSIVKVPYGASINSQLYMSLVDANLNNALPSQTSDANWQYMYFAPTIAARAHNTAGTTFTINTDTAIPFATVDYDTDSAWSTDTFTAPRQGKYNIQASVMVQPAAYNSGDYVQIYIKKNGTTVLSFRQIGVQVNSGSFYMNPAIIDTLVLAAADTIQVFLSPQKSTAGNVSLNTGLGANQIAITRVGN